MKLVLHYIRYLKTYQTKTKLCLQKLQREQQQRRQQQQQHQQNKNNNNKNDNNNNNDDSSSNNNKNNNFNINKNWLFLGTSTLPGRSWSRWPCSPCCTTFPSSSSWRRRTRSSRTRTRTRTRPETDAKTISPPTPLSRSWNQLGNNFKWKLKNFLGGKKTQKFWQVNEIFIWFVFYV